MPVPARQRCHALFDLAAYEDLLLLYAIAQTTPASVRGAPPPRARTTPEDATLSEGIGVLPTASGRQGHQPGDLLQEQLPEMGLPALDLLPAAAPQAAPSLPDYDFPGPWKPCRPPWMRPRRAPSPPSHRLRRPRMPLHRRLTDSRRSCWIWI